MPRSLSCAVALLTFAGTTATRAQSADGSAVNASAITTEPVRLSPFQIVAEDDRSYQAANSLGATRTNVAIRDLPIQINVVTEQLMADRALFDLAQVLDVMPGTARSYNEFLPFVNIRGFDSLHAMRNGVRGITMPDMTSIARVETIKGPGALIYGWAQPGGVINYITKNPSPTRKTTVRVSAGSDQLFRAELDTTGPMTRAGTFNYRLGLTHYTVENGERERSLDRVALAPMLHWKPFQHTSIIVRYGYTHDDIRPADGLVLKPTGAINRGGDSSYFYPFNGLDAPRNPQWVTSVGPDFIKESPSSYRDLKSAIWEVEATQRLNRAMDLRVNLAYHRRARSGIRETPTGALINPWTQTTPSFALLSGYTGWNLDDTPAEPFPEARFAYELTGRGGRPPVGDALADTRLLDGQPYVHDPAVRTLQYVDGVTGWRRVTWTGNNRREHRINGQLDLVTRFRTGGLQHTLLTGFEHNQDRRWENNSTLVRDPSLGIAAAALYSIPGTTTKVSNVLDYYYNIFDPVSTAARDAFAQRNVPPLSGFTSNRNNGDLRHTSNALNVNWSATFLDTRGRVALGGRYDDVAARASFKDPGINPIGFGGTLTSSLEGTSWRVTPQAGLSFRIVAPVTFYALYSQSVNPIVTFQPARSRAAETQLLDRYRQDGLPSPNLDALPWEQFLDPQFGVSTEFGVKTDLFANKVMVNAGYYVIDRKNIARNKPEADPDSVVGFVDLTGAERARGVDVDFYARPLRGLQIGGGGLYNKTEVVVAGTGTLPAPLATTFADTAPRIPVALHGLRIPNAPKWSGNAYVRYEFQEGAATGLGVGVSYVYMGARREGGDNLRWSEAWSRWDANASYRRKLLSHPTTFSLVIRNATDRIYRVDRDTFAGRRQFVGSVAFEF